jgi:hypothetical protein
MACTPTWADAPKAPMVFVHNGVESPADTRYDYHWRVLRAALDATTAQWGPYVLQPAPFMNETRQVAELQKPDGQLNTMVLDSTRELEDKLTPVRLPIDKGLLGYRVFLIRKGDQERLNTVQTLAQLRSFSIGQGADWSDTRILQQAGFHVVTGYSYEGLFGMLDHQRFDAFGRGVAEVQGEMAAFGKQYPSMAIENKLLLYYPLPMYFWFGPDAAGQERARRVEQGMRLIQAQGVFDRLFKAEFGGLVQSLNLKGRRLFKIDNPLLPERSKTFDKRWFYEPTRK